MKQILHNFKSNSSYQIRVLLESGIFTLFTSFAIAQTTAIPDNNFEQYLITQLIDADGVLNQQVFNDDIDNLTILNIDGLGIASLAGIEGFTALQTLNASNNSIVGIVDLSVLTNLTTVSLQNNQIESIVVTGLTSLSFLELKNNQLTSINVNGLTALTYLEVWQNDLSSLNVSGLNLTYLDCDENQITSLDVSALTTLQTFYCNTNNLTSLNISGLNSLTTFQCSVNPRLSCIQVNSIPVPGGFLKDATATYCTVTTWNGVWTPAAPTASSAAVIETAYSVTADINACSLTVKNNSIVTIPSNFNLNLNGALTVEVGSSLTLSNNANFVQTSPFSINTGAINVNRISNPLLRLDYTLWSSPVSGSQTLGGFSPLTAVGRFYRYNSGSNQYNVVPPTTIFSLAVPLSQARGYLIRMPNEGSANYNAGTETLVYPGVFTGTPNNGDLSVSGLTPDTYNAVGNPYPSTIDATLFLAENSTDGVLYFWRKTNAVANTTSAYATWTTLGAAGSTNAPNNIPPDGTIAVGQGFIVKTGLAATSLNFTNAMRTSSNGALFFKTNQSAVKSRIWLNLTNTVGVFSQSLIGYVEGATNGIDNGIDGKYINDSSIALTSTINNEEYTIQGRPAFDASDVVALNFKTDVAGDFNIAIDHVDGLFSGSQDIYLIDSKTGIETNLKTSFYPFTATAGVDNARFSLKYQKTLNTDEQVLNDNSVIVYKNNSMIHVNSVAKTINNVKVFDVQGKLVAERNNVKANTTSIQNLSASNQILIVTVTTDDNQVISKKVEN